MRQQLYLLHRRRKLRLLPLATSKDTPSLLGSWTEWIPYVDPIINDVHVYFIDRQGQMQPPILH